MAIKTALILGDRWRVVACPDPLPFNADYQNDHEEQVIWVAPGLNPARLDRVVAVALERAAREAEAYAALAG